MYYFSNMKKLVEQLGPSATMAEIDFVENAVIASIKSIDDAYQAVIEARSLHAEVTQYLENLSDYFKPQEESKDSQTEIREQTEVEKQNMTLYRFVKPNSYNTEIVILKPGTTYAYIDKGDDPPIKGLMKSITVDEGKKEIAERDRLQAEFDARKELEDVL